MSNTIDSNSAYLKATSDNLTSLEDTINSRKDSIDPTNQDSIDSFNALVDEYNTKAKALQSQVDNYNQSVGDYQNKAGEFNFQDSLGFPGETISKDTGKNIPMPRAGFLKTEDQLNEDDLNIKIPFTQKFIAVNSPFNNPETFGGQSGNLMNKGLSMAINLPGAALQAIPRALVTLSEEAKNYGKENQPVKTLGPIEASLYGSPTYVSAFKDIQNRIANGDGVLSAVLGGISNKVLDVAFGADVLARGFATVAQSLSTGDPVAKIEAWKTLGSPTTPEELQTNYRKLAQQFHPDKTGGSGLPMAVINKANDLLKGQIPTILDYARANGASYAEWISRQTKLSGFSDLLSPDVSQKTISPKPLGAPELPGYRSQGGPRFAGAGLSTEAVEPVGFGEESPQENLQGNGSIEPRETDNKPLAESTIQENPDNTKINQLHTQLARTVESLRAAEENPEGHAKAYGANAPDIYRARIQEIQNRITELSGKAPNSALADQEKAAGVEYVPERGEYRQVNTANKEYVKTANKEAAGPEKPSDLEQHVDNLKLQREDLENILSEHPGKNLMKYVSPETGELPEVSRNGTGKFNKAGDAIAENTEGLARDSSGFRSLDQAQESVKDYQNVRARLNGVEGELREAKGKLAEEKLAKKDERSANVLLQKKTTAAEEAIATRDTAVAKEKGIKAAIDERQKFFEQAALDKAKYDRAVEQAHKDAAEQKRSFLKDARSTVFSRLSGVDEDTKKLVLNYEADKSVAHEAGRNVSIVYKDLRQVSGMQDIIDQQAGKKNPVFKDFFDEAYTNAKRLGVTDINYQDDYMPQLWKDGRAEIRAAIEQYFKDHEITPEITEAYLKGAMLPDEVVLKMRVNPQFSYDKSIPDYKTGMKYGLTPRYTNPVDLMAWYTEHLGKVVANRSFVDKLISTHKLLATSDAPRSWQEISIPGITRGQYAAPKELAHLLEGMFPVSPEQLSLSEGWLQKTVGAAANASRALQNFALYGLGAGNINFWGMGQLFKELTTLTGALPNDIIRTALGNPNFTSTKSSLAIISRFLTTNFNKPTAKLFIELAPTFKEMAEQGINTKNRIGGIDSKEWKDVFSPMKDGGWHSIKGWKETLGTAGMKSMEKTKDSFLPLQQAITFRDAKAAAVKQGIPEEMAKQLAGEVTKHYSSALKFTGNSPMQKNLADTLFMARSTRAGALSFFWQSMKDSTIGIKDPAGFKNRDFITGLLLSYLLYNIVNKKTTGHYMFENDPNDKFNVVLPIPEVIGAHLSGYKKGDTFKFPLLPSLSYAIRAIVGAMGDFGSGDFTAGTSSSLGLASIPVQTILQGFFNQNYFGSPIYKNSDSAAVKVQKLMANTVSNVSPAPARAAISLLESKTPLYQALYNAAFLPGTFSTAVKDQNSELYNLLDQQSSDTAAKMLTAKRIDEELAGEPLAQANNQLALLKKSDPQMYEEIKNMATQRKAGLTQTEILMKQLDVTNGARAKYVDSQILKLPDSAARNAYLNELIQKKVVTAAVLAQIKALHNKK